MSAAGRRQIHLPPTFKENWANSQQWPVACGFVAYEINGLIYCWGGKQRQPTGNYEKLPADIIHCFNPEDQTWTKIEASGDIPLVSWFSAGVVLECLLYVFGGSSVSEYGNDIYSFSPSSRAFQRFRVDGARPSPRFGHGGWEKTGKLFFFAGITGPKTAATANILTGRDNDGYCDNLLCQFDPEVNEWTAVTSSGPIPSPREDFGVAQLENQVFIHGGCDGSGRPLNDFSSLDMESMCWTQLVDAGPKLRYHSLSPISTTQLFVIGGYESRAVNRTWIYDVREAKWRQEDPLANEVCRHQAVTMKRSSGVSLISLGGWDKSCRHSNEIDVLEFD